MPDALDPRRYLRGQGHTEEEISAGVAKLDQLNAWINDVAPLALREFVAAAREDWATVDKVGEYVSTLIDKIDPADFPLLVDILLNQMAAASHLLIRSGVVTQLHANDGTV